MSNRLRHFMAVMAVTLMISTSVTTTALAETSVAQGDAANAPVAVDVLVLRPAGLLSLGVGVALFAVSAPIVLVTRPHEIGRPFRQLVIRPAKYVWVDPLGGH